MTKIFCVLFSLFKLVNGQGNDTSFLFFSSLACFMHASSIGEFIFFITNKNLYSIKIGQILIKKIQPTVTILTVRFRLLSK